MRFGQTRTSFERNSYILKMLTKLILSTPPIPPPSTKIIIVYVNIIVGSTAYNFSLAEKHIGMTANHNHIPKYQAPDKSNK